MSGRYSCLDHAAVFISSGGAVDCPVNRSTGYNYAVRAAQHSIWGRHCKSPTIVLLEPADISVTINTCKFRFPPSRLVVAEPTRASIILLNEDGDGQVMIVPMDRDAFLLTVEHAVHACRAFDKVLRFRDQFEDLLSELAQWVNAHRGKIRTAHVTIRDADILLLVTQKKEEFDEELSDALSDLDLKIANDERFDLIEFNVMDTPPVSAGEPNVKTALAGGADGYSIIDHAGVRVPCSPRLLGT